MSMGNENNFFNSLIGTELSFKCRVRFPGCFMIVWLLTLIFILLTTIEKENGNYNTIVEKKVTKVNQKICM